MDHHRDQQGAKHKGRGQQRRFRRKPVTEERIRNWALGYLGRFAATEAHLVRVLERKIKRHANPEASDPDGDAGTARWMDVARTVARDMVDLGVVNDAEFAAARARTLLRQGKSRRAIRQHLAFKGVDAAEVDAALAGLADDQGAEGDQGRLDLKAALNLARRRRLGPFRRDPEPDDRVRRREYGAFARAGFPYGVARLFVEASSLEELEAALLDQDPGLDEGAP